MEDDITKLEKAFLNAIIHQAETIGLSGTFKPIDLGKGRICIYYTSNISPLTVERGVCCFKIRGRKLSIWIDNFLTTLKPINHPLFSPNDIMKYSSLVVSYTRTIENAELSFYKQTMGIGDPK